MGTHLLPESREALERLVGTVVADKYRIDRLLGRGGMGAVFQATNLLIGKRVALKFLNREAARDADAAERFQREARAAGVVESAHIVQIFDSGTSADGLPFLVMELLPGEDLGACLQREERLPATVAANIAAQVLRALMRAHAAGIVHRDLKPDNIFLCQRDDDALFVKIVDFGISKLSRSSSTLETLTRRGTVLGTAYYMSPEQAQAFDDIDGRTDLFSVGAILYECLVGHPPHSGPTYEAVLIAICTKEARSVQELAPSVGDAFARVIHRALARDRGQRFGSAQEFLDALIAALPEAFGSSPPSLPGSQTKPARELDNGALEHRPSGAAWVTSNVRRRARVGSVATALVAVLAGFGITALLVSRGSRPRPAVAAQRAPIASTSSAAPALGSPPVIPSGSSLTQAGIAATLPALAAASAGIAGAGATRQSPPSLTRPKARPESALERGKRVGVASGLELSTREP